MCVYAVVYARLQTKAPFQIHSSVEMNSWWERLSVTETVGTFVCALRPKMSMDSDSKVWIQEILN